jgi:hypothetical protein
MKPADYAGGGDQEGIDWEWELVEEVYPQPQQSGGYYGAFGGDEPVSRASEGDFAENDD